VYHVYLQVSYFNVIVPYSLLTSTRISVGKFVKYVSCFLSSLLLLKFHCQFITEMQILFFLNRKMCS
jgi:hypothetical protein